MEVRQLFDTCYGDPKTLTVCECLIICKLCPLPFILNRRTEDGENRRANSDENRRTENDENRAPCKEYETQCILMGLFSLED